MDFEKSTKRIGIIFSFFATIFLFIQGFSPSETENKNLDFLLAVLKNGVIELVFILTLGLILYFHRYLKANLFSNKEMIIKTSLIIFITVCLNYENIRQIVRSRYFHYTHIQNAHKYQLYKGVSNNLKTGQFNNAANKIDFIIKFYPDEKYILNRLKARLIRRADYSQNFYRLDDKKVTSKNDDYISLNKSELTKLIISYSLFPHPNYKDDLIVSLDVIETEIEQIKSNYKLLRTKPNSNKAKSFSSKHEWYFVDKDLKERLNKKKIKSHDFIIQMVTNHSIENLIDIQKKKWFYGLISDYLEK